MKLLLLSNGTWPKLEQPITRSRVIDFSAIPLSHYMKNALWLVTFFLMLLYSTTFILDSLGELHSEVVLDLLLLQFPYFPSWYIHTLTYNMFSTEHQTHNDALWGAPFPPNSSIPFSNLSSRLPSQKSIWLLTSTDSYITSILSLLTNMVMQAIRLKSTPKLKHLIIFVPYTISMITLCIMHAHMMNTANPDELNKTLKLNTLPQMFHLTLPQRKYWQKFKIQKHKNKRKTKKKAVQTPK